MNRYRWLMGEVHPILQELRTLEAELEDRAQAGLKLLRLELTSMTPTGRS